MKIRNGIFALGVFGVFVASLQACATEATVVDDEDTGVTPPLDASNEASTNRPDTSTAKDSSAQDSARPDTGPAADAARVDAADAAIAARPGDPFDPSPGLAEGAACPAGVAENGQITRSCNKCGKQIAFCERIGGVLKIGTYQPCGADAAGAVCLPNEITYDTCGFCGKQIKRCDTTCQYTTGLCGGEVAGGCVANSVTYIEGACTGAGQNPSDVRKQTCSATCVLGAPEPCAPRPPPTVDHTVDINATMGQFVDQAISFDAAKTIVRLDDPFLDPDPCPLVLSGIATPYRYVLVNNPGGTARVVTLETTGATDTQLAYYTGTTIPVGAGRAACTGEWSDNLTAARLTGVSIPANSSIVVYIGKYTVGAATSNFRVTTTN